jgi:hypothetical protein
MRCLAIRQNSALIRIGDAGEEKELKLKSD